MKDKLYCILRSLFLLLVLTLLFSLVFACLYYFNWISTSTFHSLNWIGGILAFLLGGVVLGLGIQKKALLYALGVLCVLGIIGFLLGEHSLIGFIKILSKLFVYGFACMLVYSKKRSTS